MCPYQRLAPCLTTDRPWLGVGMVRQPLPYDSFLRYTSVVYPGASPRSTSEPEPSSRHLYAGRHLGRKQVSPRFIPRMERTLGFGVICKLFRHLIGGSLAFAFLAHTCRTVGAPFSAALTTSAL